MEVSAREAAYHLLQLPITKLSRSVVFKNTSPPEERTFLLKSKEKLQQMQLHNTDIECSNVIKQYSIRSRLPERWSLADYVSKLSIEYPTEMEDMYMEDLANDSIVNSNEYDAMHYSCEANSDINNTLPSGILIRT